MSHVTIDNNLSSRLHGLTESVELRDENGQVLGHFVPAATRPVELLPSDRCPYTAEQLQRMRNETGGKPLSAIWEQLGAK